MASPPFNINTSVPADAGFAANHSGDERVFRDTVESWLLYEHGVSGFHKFLVTDSGNRDSAPGWGAGSMMFNTSANDLQVRSAINAWFPGSGLFSLDPSFPLTMVFHNTVAPLGWVQISVGEHNDAMVRVRNTFSGALAGASGFSIIFATGRSVSGSVAATAITTNEMPSHRHTFPFDTLGQRLSGADNTQFGAAGFADGSSGSLVTQGAGSSQAHGHGWTGTTGSDMVLKFYEVISAFRLAL